MQQNKNPPKYGVLLFTTNTVVQHTVGSFGFGNSVTASRKI